MSFWGATVITSLVTTIPVVGKQVVYWLWGGEIATVYSDINFKILLDAGTSQILFGFLLLQKNQVHSYVLNPQKFQKNVKMLDVTVKQRLRHKFLVYSTKTKDLWTQTQSAGSNNLDLQRLNAENLIWFVGFFEGDGSFSVNKNGKYLKYECSIELSIKDIQCLYKIKRLLGVGSITTRIRESETKTIEMARLKISTKKHLRRVILPVFERYPMLTSKQQDFLFFKECLAKNIVYASEKPNYTRIFESRFDSVETLLNTHYFNTWLVGFIDAEGCFSSFHSASETYRTASFCISQTDERLIIEAIRQKLKLKSKVFSVSSLKSINFKTLEDHENKFRTVISYATQTTSSHGVQNIIDFLQKATIKLQTIKKANYLKWLHEIRANPRYKNVKVPISY